jgi:2-keto-4-pentenoate hydratase/2-oxohepta-3-ene-1,7-dioic acid hydratase in catechol pathway
MIGSQQKEHTMSRAIVLSLTLATVGTVLVQAQAVTPFKVGTFQREGRTFVGIVIRDSLVADFAAASQAVTPAARVQPPADMKDFIARYDAGLRDRAVEIVRSVGAQSSARPPYVYDVKALKTMPPIMYPSVMLNVAVNYVEHGVEMAVRDGTPTAPGAPPQGSAPAGTRSMPGIWERTGSDQRWNPYMFLKSPTAVIAEGESIRIPVGRTEIDAECELGVVIGRTAARVSAPEAKNYIFGYTLQNDVSDRGGRGDTRFGGSDWLIGKSHDTFAPLGPFIVPKEFVSNPQALAIRVLLNGKPFQDGSSAQMIHDVFEQVAYGSSIMTLGPGDVIATGTPPGVGSARKPPVFLKAGDVLACTYEGVGTLTNPVANASATRASR